ncbi:hypothetical protein [uncultured Campylobacter sp.]|uniref:hypothetical protein n=1 Tax=uncultured Campylobacter sp. TaxID=218934 RepID=UPI00263613A4|nr:hypothetical protein [uncultured Campylobacter sp.]
MTSTSTATDFDLNLEIWRKFSDRILQRKILRGFRTAEFCDLNFTEQNSKDENVKI